MELLINGQIPLIFFHLDVKNRNGHGVGDDGTVKSMLLEKDAAPTTEKGLDNVWPVVTDAVSDLMPPSIRSSLFSASHLINMVVMAIHSYVISCHINTYISDTHYKACNSGAPVDSWQFVTGCTENGTCISINP